MTLELICPGLLGPIPARPHPFPKTSTLDRLLGRAERIPCAISDPEAILLAAAGLPVKPDQDLPTALLCLLADDPAANLNAHWMHADPVHLRADRDRLLLFAGADIAPDRAEANALVTLFNAHFRDDGLHLLAPTPGRWYLRVDRAPDLHARPLHQVLARSISDALPDGSDASRWIGMLNEAQMLFFDSVVNRERERQRRPVISGIWTWGGGRLPSALIDAPALIVGDHPLTRGLARYAGSQHLTPQVWCAGASGSAGSTLIAWDASQAALQAQDLSAWSQSLLTLNACLTGAENQLRHGGLSQISIHPCQGMRFQVTRRQLRRFWRRQGLRWWLNMA